MSSLNLLYLTHDLSDPATHKRVAMLRDGGASVTVAGFSRSDDHILIIAGCPAVNFGRTHNGGFVQRIFAVLTLLIALHKHRALFKTSRVVVARNLEMLAIAVRGRKFCPRPPAIVYESLDIHRLLLRNDSIGKALRKLEGRLCESASLLITSSPAFISEYFNARSKIKLPIHLLENKVYLPSPSPLGGGLGWGRMDTTEFQQAPLPTSPLRGEELVWKIGWFGAIRCKKSLDILTHLVRQSNGSIEVILRGRPSLDQFDDFHKLVAETPGITFLGPYKNPEDLAAIYNEVHFAWAIDMFEEGLNSSWLLPNRIYESCANGCVPIALANVQTGYFLQYHNIGVWLHEPKELSLAAFFRTLTPKSYQAFQSAVAAVPRETWTHSKQDCIALVNLLSSSSAAPSAVGDLMQPDKIPASATPREDDGSTSTLIIIPTLNEEANIERLVTQFVSFPIVIADGGSTDKTVDIATRLAATHPNVHLLHNSKRLQSAAVNLAAATYGKDSEFLIRIDAHAEYPDDYCVKLIEEANTTGATSIVVAMESQGKTRFQKAVAIAQNSKLGNGGSAHRCTPTQGKWVDHGHHALMRMSAFQAIGGYDETFTHNEDAELDTRLTKTGYKIWLTAKTHIIYHPRSSSAALFRQYYHYGYGRVRNLLKHRTRPKLRQLLPVAIAPAVLLALLAPLCWLFALPLAIWAVICIAYGASIGSPLSGPAAMIMHLGWSFGFWRGLIRHYDRNR